MSWLLALLACGEAESPEIAQAPPTEAEPTVDEAPQGPLPERVAARHILVQVTKTSSAERRERALQKIREAERRVKAGEDFRVVAAEVSDDGSSRRGGTLSVAEKGTWVAEFEAVAFRLEVGEVSGVVETEFGYHIIQRIPLEERHLQQVVIRYADAPGANIFDVSRSKEEARQLAAQVLEQVEGGMPFDEAARTWSEGPMAERGGDIGVVLVGELGPGIDEAIETLDPGAVTGPVESPFGFHVLKRIE